MPWVNGHDYDQLLRSNDELSDEVSRLHRTAQAVGRVAQAAQTEIDSLVGSGQMLEQAEHMAMVSVIATERERLLAEQRDSLLGSRRADFAATYRREHGGEVRQQVDQELRDTGAYAAVEQEVQASERARLRESLLDAERQKIRDELNTTGNQSEIMDQMRQQIAGSDEMTRHRKTVRGQLAEQWREEVVAEVKTTIEKEEAAGEADFKAQYRQKRLAMPEVAAVRKRKRQELQKKWAAETNTAVAEETGDEMLQEVLAEQLRLRTQQIDKENRMARLLGSFEGRGLDASDLQPGDSLVVYFGEAKQEKVSETKTSASGYPRTVQVPKTGIVYSRMIRFEATGENGLYIVRADTSSDADNPYEKGAALHNGTVVKVGRRLIDHGTPRLDPRIASQMTLAYDTDFTNSETFTQIPVPVAHIKLNDVDARQVDFVRPLQTVKKK